MQLKTVPITLKKRYPLRISRGLITENQNLLVTVSDGNFCGYGEMAAGGGIYSVTPEAGAAELANFAPRLNDTTQSGDALNLAIAQRTQLRLHTADQQLLNVPAALDLSDFVQAV